MFGETWMARPCAFIAFKEEYDWLGARFCCAIISYLGLMFGKTWINRCVLIAFIEEYDWETLLC